jgi:hypothetical protein
VSPRNDPTFDNAAYMREWRKKNPAAAKANQLDRTARNRAQTRLARLFPTTYAELLDEERIAVGLPPVGVVSRGGSSQLAKYVDGEPWFKEHLQEIEAVSS